MKSVVLKLQGYIDKASETEKGIIEFTSENRCKPYFFN